MSMKRFILIAFLILLTLSSARCAIYYVDYTGGLDSNDGLTTITAWKTIAKVNSSYAAYVPGDSILFKRGESQVTGTGNGLRLRYSGSAGGGYITIGAYGTGAKPIISHDSTTDGYPTIYSYDTCSYIRIENLDVRMVVHASGIAIGLNKSGENHIIIDSCDIQSSYHGILLKYCDTYEVSNNTLTNIGGYGVLLQGSVAPRIMNGYVHNNIITCTGVSSDGISLHTDSSNNPTGNNHIIENNIINMSGTGENCIDTACAYGGVFPSGIILRGNDVSNSGGPLIAGDGHSSTIEFNYLHDNADDGIYCRFTSTDIRYNLFANLDQYDIYTSENSSFPTSNVNIYNNTFYSAGTGKDRAHILIKPNGGGNTGFKVKNNVFFSDYTIAAAVVKYETTATPSNTNSAWNNNIYWKSTEVDNSEWAVGASNYILTNWQSTFSQDANSSFADPLFNDLVWMGLKKSSPCVNAGASLGLTNDFKGKRVPFGRAPDIGAHEYSRSIMMILRAVL